MLARLESPAWHASNQRWPKTQFSEDGLSPSVAVLGVRRFWRVVAPPATLLTACGSLAVEVAYNLVYLLEALKLRTRTAARVCGL